MKPETEKKIAAAPVRYAALDGFRAIAAVCIILMHVKANGNFNISGFLYTDVIGSFGELVFLFMIISAFGMCCGYYEKILNRRISMEAFYKKRFQRVWPFFSMLCCLDLLIAPSVNSIYEAFADITLMFGLLPNHNIQVIGVGWFLGVLFVFYLLFPFFCYLISSKQRAWRALILSVVFHLACQVRFTGAERTNIVYCAMYFIAGGIVFLYKDKLANMADRLRHMTLTVCILLTAGLYTGYYLFGQNRYFVFYLLILYSLYLIYATACRGGVLGGRVARFFSDISLEIYLCHMLVFRVMEKTGLTRILGEGVVSYLFVSIGTICGAVLFSIAAKKGLRMMEEYIRRINNRIKGGKSVPLHKG